MPSCCAVFALCEALKGDSNIVVLDLSYNLVNDLAAQALAGLITGSAGLRFINLTGNSIGAEGAKHLCRALSVPRCSLQVACAATHAS
jgi:Ran GTPase-activating protein (RanGAP) involved in mRNA processing and transport